MASDTKLGVRSLKETTLTLSTTESMSLTPEQLLEDESFRALGRRLLIGRVAVFLGAGSSIGSGAPSSTEIASAIGREVLQTDELYSLPDMVDYADGGPGRREVNRVIVKSLESLTPSKSLIDLASLPWPRVFSVNFDDLFEQALRCHGQKPVAYNSPANLERSTVSRIPVYMLHGSIKSPNDPNMGLVLTQDDLIRAAKKRAAFYHQLTDSLQTYEIVYVGFSLGDSDFRRVITELHESVNNLQNLVPRGYAVIPDPPSFAKAYWDTKKITIVDTTMEDFTRALMQLRSGRTVQPIPIGSAPILARFLSSVNPASDQADEFARSFDFPELDEGEPNAASFFRGAPPNWPTIRERIDAVRDATDNIIEDLLIDQVDEPPQGSRSATHFALLTGHAGSGKTTLAKRIAWTLANIWRKPVVWVKQPSRLQLDLIEAALLLANERIYVFVDGAADAGASVVEVMQRSRRRGLPLTFLVSERMNEWLAATERSPLTPDTEYELRRISDREATSLLQKLESAGELGVLEPLPHEEQLKRLVDRAGRQLLVGLREATEGKDFDKIIENEMNGLPRESARRAYIMVCTLFQFGIPIRAGVLSRTTGVAFDEFGEAIFRPASRVIMELQRSLREEPMYTARHSVIATVVFRRALRTARDRSDQIKQLLRQLDYGYRDDRRAFIRLISPRWLNAMGIRGSEQQEILALARELRPNDASVVQQEGLARRFDNPSMASQLLREAQKLAPQDETIRHSQALLLWDDAKNEKDETRRQTLFDRAEEAFRLLIRRRVDNSAPYVSLAGLLLEQSEVVYASDKKVRLLTEAEKTIATAFQNCASTSYMFDMSARIAEAVGKVNAAERDFKQASVAAGREPYIWLTYARFLERQQGGEAAVMALNQGIDLNPVDPSLNYELAKTLERVEPIDDYAIQRAYRLAIAEPVRGHYPELDFAIYLHRRGRTAEAEEYFANLRAARIPYSLKSKPRLWIKDEFGENITLAAEVTDVRLRQAYLTIPSLDGLVYLDYNDLRNSPPVAGSILDVNVYYNAFGLRAIPLSSPNGEDESGLEIEFGESTLE